MSKKQVLGEKMKKLLFKNNKGSAGCAVIVIIAVIVLAILALIFEEKEPKKEIAPTQENYINLGMPVEDEDNTDESNTTTTNKKSKKNQASYIYKKDSDFEITMLDVGQGLCLLIRAEDKYVLYDGGGQDKSSYVVSYLKKLNIEELSAIIVSHYDEDHFAGIIGVLNKFKVTNVLCPDGESDNFLYQSFKESLAKNGARVLHPVRGEKYCFGNADILVLNPTSYNEEGNNSSIAIQVSLGRSFDCIITGDAETEAEQSIIDTGWNLKSQLLVLGHHGSKDSTSNAFLDAVKPSDAFISCGKDNTYGHPAQETLDRLKNKHVEIYRSDKQGEVTCYVNLDEKEYGFSTSHYDNYDQEGITTTKATTTTKKVTTTYKQTTHLEKYVCNIHTKKFHRPGCPSVDQMNDSNKRVVVCNREELIAEGYDPCGRCYP